MGKKINIMFISSELQKKRHKKLLKIATKPPNQVDPAWVALKTALQHAPGSEARITYLKEFFGGHLEDLGGWRSNPPGNWVEDELFLATAMEGGCWWSIFCMDKLDQLNVQEKDELTSSINDQINESGIKF